MFAQRGLRNILYIPKLRDLPESGVDFKGLVFDFGFVSGVQLTAFATQNLSYVIERPMFVWALTGVDGGAGGFLVQLYHAHQGSVRNLFNKAVTNTEVLGTAQRPHLLPHPYMLLRGDSLECEVKSLSNAAKNVQVVLWGGEVD